MRAGFETYRAFTQDAKDLSAAVESRGKLNLPVLLLAGEASTFIPVRDDIGSRRDIDMLVRRKYDKGVCQQRRVHQDPPKLSLVCRGESYRSREGDTLLCRQIKITVIVAVYNGEQRCSRRPCYVAEAIDCSLRTRIDVSVSSGHKVSVAVDVCSISQRQQPVA